MKYTIEIIEITYKNHFALFMRNDDEYGWLEELVGELSVGDILTEIREKDFLKCGRVDCLINGRKGSVYINDFGTKEHMRKEVWEYDRRL